jgi:hypothetical protein
VGHKRRNEHVRLAGIPIFRVLVLLPTSHISVTDLMSSSSPTGQPNNLYTTNALRYFLAPRKGGGHGGGHGGSGGHSSHSDGKPSSSGKHSSSEDSPSSGGKPSSSGSSDSTSGSKTHGATGGFALGSSTGKHTASSSSSGGGEPFTLASGTPFAGRQAGGGSRVRLYLDLT